MRLVSFNINGVRARLHQLNALVETLSPDVIGLQETKVHDSEFPLEALQAMGYSVHYFGQKGHYGVAMMTRQKPLEVIYGFKDDADDAQRRIIATVLDTPKGKLTVYNGYFPQGENVAHPTKFPNKRRFYAQLNNHLRHHHQPDDLVAVLGDFNIAAQEGDIGIGEPNRQRWLREGKTSFQPEEREWMAELNAGGLSDSFRCCHPQCNDLFSWFDYRSKGFDREPKRGLRIDLIMVSRGLLPLVHASGIDYALRGMEKPSDHAPVWTDVAL